jgi:hypothetical protein
VIPQRHWLAISVCAALLVAFATLSWMSWREKGITVDEPVHFVSAWLMTRDGDFRSEPEGPPFWKYLLMLPQAGADLKLDRETLNTKILPVDRFLFFGWSAQELFDHNDGEAFIRRSRMAMLAIAALLGVLIAMWAWRLAGPVAAICATTLFAFDPNFLANAPLVKNDVALTFFWTLGIAAAWSMGRRVTVLNVALASIGCAAGVLSKLTAIPLGPLIVVLLLIRAFLPEPWRVGRRELIRRSHKVLIAVSVTAVIGVVTYFSIWAAYRFRFAPTPSHEIASTLDRMIATIARNQWIIDHGQFTTSVPPDFMAHWHEPASIRLIEFFDRAHLFPHAFLDAIISTRASSMVGPAWMLGELSMFGWWYYYPFAMLVKTPLATLGAVAVALCLLLMCWKARAKTRTRIAPDLQWTLVCFALPLALYAAMSMSSNVNRGLRHFFPVFPPLFVAAGWAASVLWRKRNGRLLIAGLGLVLVVESLHAFPDYIPFFNAAAGGSRGGLRLLSDSNIDWGQDLPLLARWQQAHPDELLQAGCFSVVDPAHYGIRSLPLPGGPGSAGVPHWPPRPGVVAVSATNLQGAYRMFWPRGEDLYAPFRKQEPIEVLGGSIYLYRVEP